jgi:hypothetical protein
LGSTGPCRETGSGRAVPRMQEKTGVERTEGSLDTAHLVGRDGGPLVDKGTLPHTISRRHSCLDISLLQGDGRCKCTHHSLSNNFLQRHLPMKRHGQRLCLGLPRNPWSKDFVMNKACPDGAGRAVCALHQTCIMWPSLIVEMLQVDRLQWTVSGDDMAP